MTYSYRYKSNPSFPYNKINSQEKITGNKQNTDVASLPGLSFLDSILSPIENIIGRKIEFDDFLLLIIIYVIFTEKNKENTSLLLCLLFILFS